ncbi:MAG: hypothetical protein QGG40_01870 [Myxococcota bacterium]|jgi:hypothetical protein|nr:hypothetical protein [Myxococcota bacterium]
MRLVSLPLLSLGLPPLLWGCPVSTEIAQQGGADPAPSEPDPGGGGIGQGAPVSGSVLVRLNTDNRDEPSPKQSQDEVRDADHVIFGGTATCEACDETLVLRISPFVQAGQNSPDGPPGPLTTLELEGPGTFAIAVPRGTSPVVVELLADRDDDARPSRGERMAVLLQDGKLRPQQDISSLVLDVSDQHIGPIGGGSTSGSGTTTGAQ